MKSTEQAEDTAPRVYVASLKDYNEGNALGRWFELEEYDGPDELLAAIGAMLRQYDAIYPPSYGEARTEWSAHDWEHVPDQYCHESPSFEAVYEYLAAVAPMDAERKQAYDYFIDNGDEPTEFDSRYLGRFGGDYHYDEDRVLEDYAETTWLECHSADEIPSSLRGYIDWAALGRDYRLSGDVWQQDGHVFRS